MATAKTPSLNASIRPLSTLSNLRGASCWSSGQRRLRGRSGRRGRRGGGGRRSRSATGGRRGRGGRARTGPGDQGVGLLDQGLRGLDVGGVGREVRRVL